MPDDPATTTRTRCTCRADDAVLGLADAHCPVHGLYGTETRRLRDELRTSGAWEDPDELERRQLSRGDFVQRLDAGANRAQVMEHYATELRFLVGAVALGQAFAGDWLLAGIAAGVVAVLTPLVRFVRDARDLLADCSRTWRP